MSKVVISADTLQKIGLVMGRDISPIEESTVGSFAEFSEKDLSDFLQLLDRSGILAVSYIRYKLNSRVDLDLVVSFLATVVEYGIPVEEWVSPGER
ncbi:hypothetical protein ACO0LF_25075 [Undibacterium sp. Di27W]|uniref:hypothetical protein n=1 Tax=Undibacterium sp. Di27W TaxID=3413036 RepID=UPI003BF1B9E4